MALACMQRFAAAATLAVVPVLGGCADEQEMLVILNAVAWSGPGECAIAGATGQVLNNGALDSSFGTGFVAPLLLSNEQPTNRTTNSGVDSSEVHLRDYDVSLSIPQAPEMADALSAQDAAFVEFSAPLQSISLAGGARQGVIVEVLTPPAVQALDRELNTRFEPGSQITVVAEIVIHAERTGNSVGNLGVISSRTFTYPIRVCSGCLIDCSPCEGGACPAEDSYAGGVCDNAQDFPLVPLSCE
jgi:hypothetical protein